MTLESAKQRYLEIDFAGELAAKATQTDEYLRAYLDGKTGIPDRLTSAMEYMVLSPGKKVRAAIVLWTCEILCDETRPSAVAAAAALEMVHTYSLIHDDLPAMDDDDLRRGRPSCHKQFDEATAILAGDALLTEAFSLLATKVDTPDEAVRMIRLLAEAAGPAGMIAGQMADMEGERKGGTLEDLRFIHVNKTARMFAAAAGLGVIAAGADESSMEAMMTYGLKLGLGFQVADDILDVSATSETLGKTAGKDAAKGKLTYPAMVGLEASLRIGEELAAGAIEALAPFGPRADILRRLAVEMRERKK
jgi:geranylgeranyl diphosphate synthase type II